jgi:hypothetical protein
LGQHACNPFLEGESFRNSFFTAMGNPEPKKREKDKEGKLGIRSQKRETGK